MHKGIAFENAVLAFFQDGYMNKVAEVHADVEEATVIYDARNELGAGANKYILVMYTSPRALRITVFYIDAMHILKAYYASTNPQRATQEERRCLVEFQNLAAAHIPAMVHAV